MSDSKGNNPLKSRLGREIYTLAALLASLPLILVGLFSLYEINSAHRTQAQVALDQSLRSFGEMLSERISQSGELANRLAFERIDAENLPPSFSNYAVIENNELLHTTFPDGQIPTINVRGTPERPQLSTDESTQNAGVFLSMRSGPLVFIGELNQFRLWSDRSIYPFATEFCIILTSRMRPLFCSAPLPDEQLADISSAVSVRGSLDWTVNNESWHTSYRDIFLSSAIDSEPIRIVGSQPAEFTYGASAAFRQIYIPGLLLALVITLIGAGYHARRFLKPLSTLLTVTQRYANRDFSARASLDRNDEFQDLANALNSMALALDRQFRSREALSRLDQLILEGDSMEDIFRTSVSEALSYLPFDSIELEVEADSGDERFRYTHVRGEDSLTKAIAESDAEIDQQFAELCVSAEIYSSEEQRGIVRGYYAYHSDSDPAAEEQLKALADRISLALEFNEQSAELNRRAWYDELTGLPNRESCLRKIDRAIATAEYNGHFVALLYIDLDGFKSVNDSLGHEAGDQLIRMAAERITTCVGHHGLTARLGGDEFAVIFPYSSGRSEEYKTIGKLILADLQAPFKLGNSEAFLGASIGAARYPDDGDTHAELLRKADAAMYRAKDSGRGRQVDYSRTLGIVIAKRMRLEADLNRALERNEMSLVYQPQVDLRTGQMDSAEALLRWNHSKEGAIAPEEFIPIAEETNQIITLGNWVIFNACAQFREWHDRGLGLSRIAVNVSANQLRSTEFISQVRECLERFRLRPDMLELELTEGVFAGSKEITASIHALKQLGITISIDDFGTGYSSLGYLKNLEFDRVKVDRSFVGSLPHDKQSASIIQAVLAMCRTLDKPVIAEGVETSLQLQYLASAGVEFAQGYYFGKPVPPQEFEFVVRAAQEATDNTIHRIATIRAG